MDLDNNDNLTMVYLSNVFISTHFVYLVCFKILA